MKKIGLWIDYREAVMVSLEAADAKIEHIESHADRHFHPSGGWKSSGTTVAQSISKERPAEERRNHQLHAFYKNIIAAFDNAPEVFIFGPGEAKHELVKEMAKQKALHTKPAAVETCDKLTENQIAAKVKTFFAANP